MNEKYEVTRACNVKTANSKGESEGVVVYKRTCIYSSSSEVKLQSHSILNRPFIKGNYKNDCIFSSSAGNRTV